MAFNDPKPESLGAARHSTTALREPEPVRLFMMTFLPGGISVGFPDFGFFLLKKRRRARWRRAVPRPLIPQTG